MGKAPARRAGSRAHRHATAQAIKDGDKPAGAANPDLRTGRTDPMKFKRTLQRYGQTPEPVTPYQKAAQLWDERIGSSRVRHATGG
jgi:hypothetical protein